MNQDRDKKFLALTLMYLPNFFSIILKSVKKNVAKKKEKYETRRILFQTLILQKTKTVVRKHHYCLFGCWNIIRRRMVWQKVMDFLFVCLFVCFCIRALKVQIRKSYFSYQKYVSVPKRYYVFLSFHVSRFFSVSRPFKQ